MIRRDPTMTKRDCRNGRLLQHLLMRWESCRSVEVVGGEVERDCEKLQLGQP